MPEAPTSALRERAARVARRLRGRDSGRSLEERVSELEDEVQELRRLNRRLAELVDVVEELLVPLSEGDQDRVREYLDSHSAGL